MTPWLSPTLSIIEQAKHELGSKHPFEPRMLFDTSTRVSIPEWQSGVPGYYSYSAIPQPESACQKSKSSGVRGPLAVCVLVTPREL